MLHHMIAFMGCAAQQGVPQALEEQLAPNGVMIIPVEPADNGPQTLIRVRKDELGSAHHGVLDEVFSCLCDKTISPQDCAD